MTPSDAEIKLDDHVPLWTMGNDRKIQKCCNNFLSNPNTICVWTVRSKHSRGAEMDIFEFQPKQGRLFGQTCYPTQQILGVLLICSSFDRECTTAGRTPLDANGLVLLTCERFSATFERWSEGSLELDILMRTRFYQNWVKRKANWWERRNQ
jgi:hypothetical protein